MIKFLIVVTYNVFQDTRAVCCVLILYSFPNNGPLKFALVDLLASQYFTFKSCNSTIATASIYRSDLTLWCQTSFLVHNDERLIFN